MKSMFRKILYPLTDWSWPKLPLAATVIGALFASIFLATAGKIFFHDEKPDHIAGSMIAGMGLAQLLFILVLLASVGYLIRITRQPGAENPHKLPTLKDPLGLLKEGFMSGLGAYISSILVALVVTLPPMIIFTTVLAFNHSELTGHWLTVAEATKILGFAGAIFTYLLVILALGIWNGCCIPLLMTRYAYTGKLRHFFGYRWLWNAVTIAPLEFFARAAAWTILLWVVTILTPLTAGWALVIGYLLAPLSAINTFYLIGDYYHQYLDD